MPTITHLKTLNQRTERARVSKGWSHDSRHFHFERQHKSNAPFVESAPQMKITAVDLVSGVIFAVSMAVLAAYAKGWI